MRIGDTVTARVEGTGKMDDKGFITFRTTATVRGKVVIDGEATLMVPKKG